MKNVKTLIGTFAIAIAVFVACQKQQSTKTITQNSSETALEQSTQINQKTYNISNDKLLSTIILFKGTDKITPVQAKINSNSSVLALDSSIWLVEAALNYDFDTQPSQLSNYYNDSASFQTSINSATISANDLNIVYNYFNNYFTQKINGTTKLKIVDISAFQGATGIVYKAYAVLFTGGQNKTNDNRCAGINDVAAWSASDPGSCSGNSSYNDGPSICNVFLNCNNYVDYSGNCPCQNPIFTNVTNLSISNSSNSYPSVLYYKDLFNSCDNTILTVTQLQNYVSNIQSYAVANIPSTPSGMVISNYNITTGFLPITLSHIRTWWGLTVTYATVGCGRCWHN